MASNNVSINILDYALLSREKIDTETWTTNLENTMQATVTNLKHLVASHHEAMEYFQRLDRVTNIVSILFHGVLSIFQIISTILLQREMLDSMADLSIDVFAQILTHSLLVYVTILGVYQFGSRSQDHKLSSIEFLQLEMHINTQLELPRNMRYNSGQYYEWVNNTYTARLHKAPTIPKYILRKHNRINLESMDRNHSGSVDGVGEMTNSLLDYQISRFNMNTNNNNLS